MNAVFEKRHVGTCPSQSGVGTPLSRYAAPIGAGDRGEGEVLVHDDDRLHAELDRQLAEVRAACDGIATRSGLLGAAIGAVAPLLGPRIDPKRHEILLVVTLLVLGVATVALAITLIPWLKVGPETLKLGNWMSKGSSETTSSEFYDAKNYILDGNLKRRLVMMIFFALQATATICSVGLALWYTAWR